MRAGRHRRAVGAAALALWLPLAALAGGCARAAGGAPAPAPGTTSEAATEATAGGGAEAASGFRSPRGYRAVPAPVRIAIPRIGVAAPLDRLGKARDGTVEVPTRWELPGWYERGPRPGEPGSAVILGHVDSKRGPAVFHRLRELRRGDVIEVARADGSVVRFAVARTGQYDKRSFPTEEVYLPTLAPELRLVTCGGEFDRAVGHYRDNVIVFAAAAPAP